MIAPAQACFIFLYFVDIALGGPDMYILDCLLVGLDCIFKLPLGRL